MAIVATKNGVLRDTETNRFVKGGKPTTAIVSSSQGREMAARKQELKRQRIQAGAAAAVATAFPDKFTGEADDWIEAVAEQIALKALDRLDPKQVDAARFLLTEAGLSEKQAESAPSGSDVPDVIRALADFASQLVGISAIIESNPDSVEGEIVTDSSGRLSDYDK